jgi:hypothetical protein
VGAGAALGAGDGRRCWRALHDEGIAARFDAAMQALWLPGGTPLPHR